MGFVPQGRWIFPSLTVEENLTVAERAGPWSLERVYELFPSLAERRAHMGNQISGGEQQMLAIGRALMGNPALLLMDEPLEGLAPIIVDALLGMRGSSRRIRPSCWSAVRAACTEVTECDGAQSGLSSFRRAPSRRSKRPNLISQ
jgi:branched-chain amino acid transport system ATP-binding protein